MATKTENRKGSSLSSRFMDRELPGQRWNPALQILAIAAIFATLSMVLDAGNDLSYMLGMAGVVVACLWLMPYVIYTDNMLEERRRRR